METIKINLTTPSYGSSPLTIERMQEANGELLIKLRGKEHFKIFKGQTLFFKRYIYGEKGKITVLTDYSTVIGEDKDHIIHATIPPVKRIKIKGEISKQENTVKTNYFSGITSNGEKYEFNTNAIHDRCEYIGNGAYILNFAENHYIFAQDLASNNTQTIYLYDYKEELIGTFSGASLSAASLYTRPVQLNDCLSLYESQDTCDKVYDYVNTYEYTFLPDSVNKNGLILSGLTTQMILNAAYAETKFNPFYYYTETNETDKYGNRIRECHLYEDVWWSELTDIVTTDKRYVTQGTNKSILAINESYWDIPVGLSIDANDQSLGSEDSFGTTFIDDLTDSIIPPIIDMERVKYSPVIESNNSICIAKKLIFDLHFRKRVLATPETCSANTELTTGNTYMDGWYIDPDANGITWWNGMDYDGSEFDANVFENFYSESGHTSDLLGYLNFTDKDVYFRKQKVNKSFIRLSFYNSNEAIGQKLLFYSTVFLDGTSLYGKYVKELLYMEENSGATLSYSGNTDNAKIVFCNEGTRVDSEITITNEYDRTRSSEGFNIYLFADDIEIKDENTDAENSSRTIYMKVEFNHAGNGKTIPMILWPKNNGKYVPLKVENFFKSLYIPVKVKYLNDRYVYTIESAENDSSDGTIRLVLFEPKLDEEKWKE